MTDKFSRRSGGGDGDGPAETATERLLREAMGARAALVTANSLRPAAPPRNRVRRLRPVYAVTVPLGLAAAMALGVLTFHGEPVAHDQVPPPAATLSASPSPTAEPTATPAPSVTPTDTGTPTGEPETEAPLGDPTPSSSASATNTVPSGPSTSYTFRGVKFKVPAGWKTVQLNDSLVCVLSPGAPAESPQGWSQQVCEPYGVTVTAYNTQEEVDGGGWPKMVYLDTDSGWSNQPYCPLWDNPHEPVGESVTSVGPVKSAPTLSGRSARKSQWQVTCGKSAFTAQVWALPKDQVFVAAVGLKSDYQAGLQTIVNSLDVSGHKAPGATPSAAPVSDSDIAISFSGILPAGLVSAKDTPVTFAVTYRNTSQNAFEAVQPVLFTEPYAGSPASETEPVNSGKLERQDGNTWVPLPMSPVASMRHLTVGKPAAFPLAPGQSKTVLFRLAVDSADGPGVMPVTAQAMLPYDGTGQQTFLGRATIRENVVK
ncbi:hypothetical protein ACIRD3_16155 [Kitasatospora sp. NPDC093550]|uniref:hypothetical protein n=1 Tax=Kitasatospora sp. NPDC093550 TaxID=3364089 RepID=UPI00380B5476